MNQIHQSFLDLLRRWSRSMALVSAGDRERLSLHLEDSKRVAREVPVGAERLVDVGAGAGFPGVVIAIECPELQVTLLEPNQKKWAFLRTVKRELGLKNLEARAERDEEHLAQPSFRPYDVAVSRATFDLVEWLDRGLELVAPGGLVIGMEGRARATLPPDARRIPYELEGRSLALVLRRRPGAPLPGPREKAPPEGS